MVLGLICEGTSDSNILPILVNRGVQYLSGKEIIITAEDISKCDGPICKKFILEAKKLIKLGHENLLVHKDTDNSTTAITELRSKISRLNFLYPHINIFEVFPSPHLEKWLITDIPLIMELTNLPAYDVERLLREHAPKSVIRSILTYHKRFSYTYLYEDLVKEISQRLDIKQLLNKQGDFRNLCTDIQRYISRNV